jgi:hypothetical protein
VIIMLLVLMLEQLAQVAKQDVARLATVRKVWSSVIAISVVFQHWSGDELLHLPLGRSKFIDLIPRIVLSSASRAVTTLNVLDSVGTRTESTVSTNRTRNLFWAVHLHVHVEVIFVSEYASTRGTLAIVGIDTGSATRLPLSFVPLIDAELITAFQTSACGTWSPNTRAATRVSITTGPLVVAELISMAVSVTVTAIPAHVLGSKTGSIFSRIAISIQFVSPLLEYQYYDYDSAVLFCTSVQPVVLEYYYSERTLGSRKISTVYSSIVLIFKISRDSLLANEDRAWLRTTAQT